MESGKQIRAACYQCHVFSDQKEGYLVSCQCGAEFVALRLAVLTIQARSAHRCLRWAPRIATDGDTSLIRLKSPSLTHFGTCAVTCRCSAPWCLISEQEERNGLDLAKKSRINILPVCSDIRPMFHATHESCVEGIREYGLLSREYIKHNHGHGNPRTEKWLRFTGGMVAAKAHMGLYDTEGRILPIGYSGKILETCMDLYPDDLLTLFEQIPLSIGCIRMNEDGESYVFRKSIHLPVVNAICGALGAVKPANPTTIMPPHHPASSIVG